MPAARRLVPIALILGVGGCGGGVTAPAGPVGEADLAILLDSLAIMLAIVVPTIAAALGFAWWFRSGNPRARYRPDWAFSGQIELVVWSIPLIVIIFLGGIIWVGSHRLDPARPLAGPAPLEVQVVSLDWKWLFLLPGEGVASVNALVVPAGVPLRLRLTSSSVMNVFFVPRLGSMIYTMNGMATTLNLKADRPGRYPGQSSHFSGDGFADMRFAVTALAPADFARWAASARAAPPLDRAGYVALAKPSRQVAPATYRLADTALFDAIVTQAIPPAPGPTAGRAGARVSPRS